MFWRLLVLFTALAAALAAALVLRAAFYADRSFRVERTRPVRPADLAGARDAAFRTEDGLTLRGWFLPPRNGATVLLVHGLGQDRAGLLPEARVLIAAGYGVLLFDLRAHGESDGEWPTWGDRERRDVAAATRWLLVQPDVDPARLGALGFSVGANALAEVAVQEPRLAAVALLSPSTSLAEAVDLDAGRSPLNRLGARLAYRRRGVSLDLAPLAALPRLAPRPVWTVAGALEEGQWMTDALFAATPGGRTWLVPGAGHGDFAHAAPEEYPRRLRAFFDEAFGLTAPGAAAAAR